MRYRGRGGNYFDEDDGDDDDDDDDDVVVDVEGQNEGHILLWASEPILKFSCHYLYYWLRYRLHKEKRPIVIMPTHPKLTR